MPEAEENKQDLVDIDTSGPGAEIEIDEPVRNISAGQTMASNQPFDL